MTDWIEHNGGPQPVGDDVWVEVNSNFGVSLGLAEWFPLSWEKHGRYRILNQHLIDAARKEGIRLGLEAAAKQAEEYSEWSRVRGRDGEIAGFACCASDIRALKTDTIAKEAGQ